MVEVAQQLDLTRRLLELGKQIVALAQDVSTSDAARVGDAECDTRGIFNFGSTKEGENFVSSSNDPTLEVWAARPPLPDPRLIRKIIRQRQLRSQVFDHGLFADPAWDILLDMTAARAEHKRVSITSLCIAAGVPATTALRWIQQLIDVGLLTRCDDDIDRRRAFVSLSDHGADLVARYFMQLDHSNSLFI